MSLEQSYEEVSRTGTSPAYRQDFLDEFHSRMKIPQVRRIRYVPNGNSFENGHNASFGPNEQSGLFPLQAILGYHDPVINVYPSLLKRRYNLFVSTVVDHEGTHAKQWSDPDPLFVSILRKGGLLRLPLPTCFKKRIESDIDILLDDTYVKYTMNEIEAYDTQLANAALRGLNDTEIEEIEIKRMHRVNSLEPPITYLPSCFAQKLDELLRGG